MINGIFPDVISIYDRNDQIGLRQQEMIHALENILIMSDGPMAVKRMLTVFTAWRRTSRTGSSSRSA